MTKNNYNYNNQGEKSAIKKVAIAVGAVVAVIALGLILMRSGGNTSTVNGQQSDASLNSLVGKALPSSVQLYDINGKEVSLDSLKGKNTVLFFNEGIMCYPACWDQIEQFGSDSRFNSNDTTAISVVTDQQSQWQEAIAKTPALAKANLLFDQGSVASRQLGMLTLPSSMHKGTMPGHTYIVLDKQGIVRFVFDDPNMAVNNDMLFQKISTLNK